MIALILISIIFFLQDADAGYVSPLELQHREKLIYQGGIIFDYWPEAREEFVVSGGPHFSKLSTLTARFHSHDFFLSENKSLQRGGGTSRLEPMEDEQYDHERILNSLKIKLPASNHFVFPVSPRRWDKSYQDYYQRPIIFNSVLVLRTEMRVYGISLKEKKILWMQAPWEDSGIEYYSTYRYPDINSAGTEMAIADGKLFTELNHYFYSFDLNERGKEVWSHSLAEYTLVAKPIVCANTVVLNLINDRGDIWFVGLEKNSGEVVWQNFLGNSSYHALVSEHVACKEEIAYIGSNHGVISALNSRDGKILWREKYRVNEYSLFDLFANQTSLGREEIVYSPSFSALSDKHWVFRPFESHNAYLIDIENGQYKEYSSRKGEVILGNISEKILVAERSRLKLVDSDGRVIAEEKFVSNQALRSFSATDGTIWLQAGSKIYKVKFNNDQTLEIKMFRDKVDGVLVAVNKDFLVSKRDSYYYVYTFEQSSFAALELRKYDEIVQYEKIPKMEAGKIVRYRNIVIKPGVAQTKTLRDRGSVKKQFEVSGPNARVVPCHEKTKSKERLFFVLNADQLLAIDKFGHVIWERPVINTMSPDGQTGPLKFRLYRFEETLVIDDRYNVIAVDYLSGKYRWSSSHGMDSKNNTYDSMLFANKNVWVKDGKDLIVVDTHSGIPRRVLRDVCDSGQYLAAAYLAKQDTAFWPCRTRNREIELVGLRLNGAQPIVHKRNNIKENVKIGVQDQYVILFDNRTVEILLGENLSFVAKKDFDEDIFTVLGESDFSIITKTGLIEKYTISAGRLKKESEHLVGKEIELSNVWRSCDFRICQEAPFFYFNDLFVFVYMHKMQLVILVYSLQENKLLAKKTVDDFGQSENDKIAALSNPVFLSGNVVFAITSEFVSSNPQQHSAMKTSLMELNLKDYDLRQLFRPSYSILWGFSAPTLSEINGKILYGVDNRIIYWGGK